MRSSKWARTIALLMVAATASIVRSDHPASQLQQRVDVLVGLSLPVLAQPDDADGTTSGGTTGPGACCLGSGVCVIRSAEDCAASGGDFMGSGAPCVANLCRGGCCRPNGTCSENIPRLNCQSNGGSYLGHGSNCTGVTCPELPNGACCQRAFCQEGFTPEACTGHYAGDDSTCNDCPGACCLTDDSCLDTTRGDCLEIEGATFAGNLTDCPPDGCGQGACCFATTDPAGFCTGPIDPFNCELSRGLYLGHDTDCETSTCPAFGGGCCCGSCFETTADHCATLFSCAFLGEGVPCPTDNTCPPTGACCPEFGPCADHVVQTNCEATGGSYAGDDTLCQDTICPEQTGACCFSDGSCIDPMPQSDCVVGGNLWHHNQTCADVTCQARCETNEDCDDGDLCNGAEFCADGFCFPGVPPEIDDGVGCTIDVCDPATGKVSHIPNDLTCSDGDPCNGIEFCNPELDCQALPPADCDDGIDCTNDFCDITHTAADPVTGCVNLPDNTRCDDGVACTVGQCLVFDAQGGCFFEPNDELCLDESLCTENERCDILLGCQFDPVNCDDGIPCTIDTCDPAIGCLNGAEHSLCNDGIECTIDRCRPLNPDRDADGCVYEPDDGFCPTTDLCVPGRCDPATGCQFDPRECPDDGDPCTRAFCDAATGKCETGLLCGACCREGSPCLDGLTPAQCAGPFDTFLGIGSECASASCGACCDIDTGACFDGVTEDACEAADRAFQGPDTDCAIDRCLGACCDPGFTVSGCVDDVTAAECAAIDVDTIFTGVGTTCANAPCGACCDPLSSDTGTSCLNFATDDLCTAIGYTYVGDQTSCDPNPCQGACCLPDGSCLVTPPEECPGDFRGNGTDCAELNPPCVPFVGGACCQEGGACLDDTTPETCATVFHGRHQGDETQCDDIDCETTGACCLPDGTCVQATQAGCPDGTFQGAGTICPHACQGACCHPDGSCNVGRGPDCPGDYRGDGTNCAELNPPCQPFAGGACCRADGSCIDGTTAETCVDVHFGRYLGDETRCAEVDCEAVGACCLEDGSCVQASEVGCANLDGIFLGGGVPCAGDECPDSCKFDEECDDGRFCNGEETCVGFLCRPGIPPCRTVDQLCDEAGNRCIDICTTTTAIITRGKSIVGSRNQATTAGLCVVLGDADGDGDLDLVDAAAFFNAFGQQVEPGDPAEVMDLNRDGVIDLEDYALFLAGLTGQE